MTAAICLQCGAEKLGALTPCTICEFTPHSEIDQAKSILLSDHFLPGTELDTTSNWIKNGKQIDFSEDQIAAIVKEIRSLHDDELENIPAQLDKFNRKCRVVSTVWIIAATAILICFEHWLVFKLTASLLLLSIFPIAALWADFLIPLCRTCRSCRKRGVLQGTVRLVDSKHAYDKWNWCRKCGNVYLHVKKRWIAHGKVEFPCP